MQLPATPGERMQLAKLQSLPDGDFILAGTVYMPGGLQEGIVIRTDNEGNIRTQKRLRINNQSTGLSGLAVLLDGRIVLNGILQDGTNSIFVTLLNNDLQTEWVRKFSLSSIPGKITVGLFDTTSIAFAVQLSSSIVYAALSVSADVKWMKETSVQGLDELVGFSSAGWGHLGLISNVTRTGKKTVLFSDVDITDGAMRASNTLDGGEEESRCVGVSSFNTRLNLQRVIKSASNEFRLERTINYSSLRFETKHSYRIPGTIDLGISGSMDNAADVLGFMLPQDGKLIYIRHYSAYQTAPEYTRGYSVPVDASLQAVARSFVDGGFLFGMNSSDSSKIILLKTDSIGILKGCDYTNVTNTFQEVINSDQNNYVSTESSSNASAGNSNGALSLTAGVLAPVYNCKEFYCPPPVMEDSCLSSFYKSFRTNSYTHAFGDYHLMRNNVHLVLSGRTSRILGSSTQVIPTLQIFTEKGQFIKGITLWNDNMPLGFTVSKVTDSTVMLTSSKLVDEIPYFTFSLFNDNLELIWTKSIKTYKGFEFGGGYGYFSGDIHRDQEGNYYMVGLSPGFNPEKPKLLVYKMNEVGDMVWLKAYSISSDNHFGSARLVTTSTSVIVLIEGNPGGTSVRLDKSSGAFLNAYRFNNGSNGQLHLKFAKFEQNRIFYACNTSAADFLMGTFDTLGRPLRLRFIQNSSIYRAADARDGMLYAAYNYFNGSEIKEVLLKVDTALNIKFFHEYDLLRPLHIIGLGVNSAGSIYLAGNHFSGGVNATYVDPFLQKFTDSGELGTCAYQTSSQPIIEVDPQTTALQATPLQRTVLPSTLSFTIRPDSAGQRVSELLCSSSPQCSQIQLAGPQNICTLNTDVTIAYTTNGGCNVKPSWLVDTAYTTVQSTTSGTLVLKFKKTGITWIKAKLNSGCKVYFDSLSINVYDTPLSLGLGSDQALCPGNTIILNARKGYASYQWQDGSADSVFTVTQPGLYHVTTTDACGGMFKDSVLVTAAPPIPFSVGADRTKCNSDTVHLAAPAGFINYTWSANGSLNSTPAQTIVVNPLVGTTYYIKAEKTPGCFAFDTVHITVHHSPPISLGSDQSFCLGDSAAFSAGPGFQNYAWSNGATTERIIVKSAGAYAVTGTTGEGCKSRDTVLVVSVYALPVVALDQSPAICAGSVKQLDAGPGASYLWNTGAATQRISVDAIGRYSVTVTDVNGCKANGTTAITTIHTLPKSFLPPDTAICSYGDLQLRPLLSFSRYSWSTGSSSAAVTIKQPGIYWMDATDANGCKGRDSVLVQPKECLKGFYVPTAFTPNSDGRNDRFLPLLFGTVVRYEFTIFNRWGEVLFRTNDVQKGWDGKLKGLPLGTAVFVWTCTYQFEGEGTKMEKGTVTLVR